MTTDAISGAITQRMLRREAARLIGEGRVDLVHQPIPVSPRAPSTICGLGVPVVMGPLNGGMDFPPAFRNYDGAVLRLVYGLGRRLSGLGHLLADGKLRADALLVANLRTARACRRGSAGRSSSWSRTASTRASGIPGTIVPTHRRRDRHALFISAG